MGLEKQQSVIGKTVKKIKQLPNAKCEKTLKLTVPIYEKIDKQFLLFSQERQKAVPISTPLLQEKALQLNKLMNGDSSFTASNGWLYQWQKRHGVRQLSISRDKL